MEDRVSSGNWAKVADVNHVRGTRSQSVMGLAEWFPIYIVSFAQVKPMGGRGEWSGWLWQTGREPPTEDGATPQQRK